jgi:hypothetical protein
MLSIFLQFLQLLLLLLHNYFFHILSVLKIFDGLAPSFVDIFNVLHHPGLTQFLDVIFYDPIPLHPYFSIAPHAL